MNVWSIVSAVNDGRIEIVLTDLVWCRVSLGKSEPRACDYCNKSIGIYCVLSKPEAGDLGSENPKLQDSIPGSNAVKYRPLQLY